MPRHGEWYSLVSPPNDLPLERLWVSSPVIPDEKNQRLLVHFQTAYALYAYYSVNGNWELLAPKFWHWFNPAALVDGVLYSHAEGKHDCLVAYDLMTKSWLKVEYSAYFRVEVCISEFSNMLHLGCGMLCLANGGYTPHFDSKLGKPGFSSSNSELSALLLLRCMLLLVLSTTFAMKTSESHQLHRALGNSCLNLYCSPFLLFLACELLSHAYIRGSHKLRTSGFFFLKF